MRIKTRFPLNHSFIFFSMWAAYIFSYYVLTSDFSYLFNTSTIFTLEQYGIMLILLISAVFFSKYGKKTSKIYLCFAIFAFLMQYYSTNKVLLLLTLFVLAARDIDFRKIVELDMKVRIAALIVVTGACLAGIINNYTAEINGTYKQAMGFSHPNIFGGLCYIILLEYILTKWQKIKPVHFICTALLGIIVMEVSGSRTMGYTFFGVYLIFILYKLIPKLFYLKIVRAMFIAVMPTMFAASFLLVRLYNQHNKLAIKLNDILTTRIALGAKFLDLYDIQPWGQEIEIVGTRKAQLTHTTPMILDNAYLRGTLMYGMLFMLFLNISYILLMHYLLKKKKAEYAIFSLYFILIGIGESYMINIAFNTTLLLLIEHCIEKFSLMDIQSYIRKRKDNL